MDDDVLRDIKDRSNDESLKSATNTNNIVATIININSAFRRNARIVQKIDYTVKNNEPKIG
ncbi:MAG: hypothetical protein ACC656_06260 [Candidatus Heimdallarchaeota archaeon]